MKTYIKKTADGISVWFNFQDEFYTLPDYYEDQRDYMEKSINDFIHEHFTEVNNCYYHYNPDDFRWVLSRDYEFSEPFYGIVIYLNF